MKKFVLGVLSLVAFASISNASTIDASERIKNVDIKRSVDGLELSITMDVCNDFQPLARRFKKIDDSTLSLSLVTQDGCAREHYESKFRVEITDYDLKQNGVNSDAKIYLQIK